MKICDKYSIYFIIAILLSFARVKDSYSSSEDNETSFNVFRKQFPLGEKTTKLRLNYQKRNDLVFREAVWSVYRG